MPEAEWKSCPDIHRGKASYQDPGLLYFLHIMSKEENSIQKEKRALPSARFWFWAIFLSAVFALVSWFPEYLRLVERQYRQSGFVSGESILAKSTEIPRKPLPPPLDKKAYDAKMQALANDPPEEIKYKIIKVAEKGTDGQPLMKDGKPVFREEKIADEPLPAAIRLWPPAAPYPEGGAILPFKRVVAFYGNLYSRDMGVLGKYPEDQMLSMLEEKVKEWETADLSTPVVPALHYIAVTAQDLPGKDGNYIARMPDSQIEKVLGMAKKINGIVFLDLQVGKSDLPAELPRLKKYLRMPEVNLGIDPEFSMKDGASPGKKIGTFDAADINYAAEFLAEIVKKNQLVPKILVVHRFTENMVTNYRQIKPLPQVEIVMNMDGWGRKANKIATYKEFIASQPVQFTGFKLFFKEDTQKPGSILITPEEILKLRPIPIYIQYQ